MFPLSPNLFSNDMALELSNPSTFSAIGYCIFFFIVSVFFKESSEALDPLSSEEFSAPCSSCISFFTGCHAALCHYLSPGARMPLCHPAALCSFDLFLPGTPVFLLPISDSEQTNSEADLISENKAVFYLDTW